MIYAHIAGNKHSNNKQQQAKKSNALSSLSIVLWSTQSNAFDKSLITPMVSWARWRENQNENIY